MRCWSPRRWPRRSRSPRTSCAAGLLPEPVPAPTEDQLVAFHKANEALYTRPETRRITYALLEPETLAATIEIPEDELRR
ncbi:hypothetical protein CNY89_27965, partial [Amaricoccus sp. HAR-UPW-R2A-40]